MDTKISEICEMIKLLTGDTAIPKNIRKALTDSYDRLQSAEEANVKVSAAIYLIESVSDDINMPPHARTQIWAIVGALESLKNQ